ncbi:MAG: hypothetical protein AMJ62_08550 [Myxococcales bacterium SG8_38]|nr:MAG: hypothetical protein AMJ62_08550 [Myxococcales bacterium SG8_38]
MSGLAVAGCARDSSDSGSGPSETGSRNDVVARVDGRVISASEVAARMKADGVSAEEALDTMIDEVLLVAEARRLELSETEEDERAIDRLMVRSLLRDIEREITPESISKQEVRRDFESHAEKLQSPERRRSWHIVVKDRSEAGKALAQSILKRVRRADDPRVVYERYADSGDDDAAIEVEAEELPAITMKARIERPYKEALFSAESPGLLNRLVETSHGWHIVFLQEIVPAERRTIDEVEDEIRERLSQKKRFESVVAIIDRLRAEGLVSYDDEGVERLLSMRGLPERAE